MIGTKNGKGAGGAVKGVFSVLCTGCVSVQCMCACLCMFVSVCVCVLISQCNRIINFYDCMSVESYCF